MPELNLNMGSPISNNSVPQSREINLVMPEKQSDKGIISAVGSGFYQGIDALATSFLKLGSKLGLTGKDVNPESLQATYDANVSDYNKVAAQHPIAAKLGNIAGQLTAMAPLMAVPVAEGAGLGSMAAAGKLGLNLGSNALQGALVGGLTTQQGQNPNQIWNSSNAGTQAALSAPFTMAGAALGNFVGKTTQLEQAQINAAKAGYTGKIIASDLPSQGIIDSAHKLVTSTVLNNLPGARAVQNKQIMGAVDNYINNLAGNTLQQSTTKIANILDKHSQELDNTYNNLWSNFTSKLGDTPIDRSTSLPILKDILNDPNQVAALTTRQGGELQAMRQGLQANTAEDMFRFKNDAWNIYERLQDKINAKTATPGEVSLAQNAKRLYGNTIEDMKSGLANNPNALQAYEAARTFSVPYKNLFDPSNRKQIVNAIQDIQNQQGGVDKFINWTLNKANPQMVADSQKVLGQTGTQAMAGYGLRELYDSSLKTVGDKTTFRVNKFLQGLNQLQKSDQAAIYQPSIDAMQGLTDVMKQYANAVGNGQSEGMGRKAWNFIKEYVPSTALGVGVASAHTGLAPIAAGIALAPMAMSAIAKSSPLKNALIFYNKSITQNPGSAQYFLQRVANHMNKLGIAVTNDDQGNMILDQQK